MARRKSQGRRQGRRLPKHLRCLCRNIFDAVEVCRKVKGSFEPDIDAKEPEPDFLVRPGSKEKIELLRRRVMNGETLFSELDGRLVDVEVHNGLRPA